MQDFATNWLDHLNQPPAGCTPQQWDWLVYPHSLTERLRQISGNTAHINLLHSGWGKIYPEEAELLGQTEAKFWTREITHVNQNQPWVWARVVIPAGTLHNTGLDPTTTQPIGDILFKDPHLTRTHLAIAEVSANHVYYQHCLPFLQTGQQPWGRRSILRYQQMPLLIAEVFLPAFFRDISC
jgi:chorismate lyase